MVVHRIDKIKYLSTVLHGIPGEVSDFRWNTKGNRIIYASESKSLAFAEKSGNMSRPFYGISRSFVFVIITLPDLGYRKIKPQELPLGWNDPGSYHQATQDIGDLFTKSHELVLWVPSAMVDGEFNILINPNKVHDDSIKVEKEELNFRFYDSRL